jgi:hypothetical protein
MPMTLAAGIASSPLGLAAIVLCLLGIALVLAAIVALLRVKPLGSLVRLLAGALLLAVGLLLGALGIGVQGYRALTHEELAAHISLRPLGPQHFAAVFRFPDDTAATFELAGDEIYVDAHILKWHPWANVLGLHTGYELARVAGRYQSIAQERTAPRTVHALAPERPVDLFALRRQSGRLALLVDAEYGSASFVAADRAKELELRVSTSGLLIREVPPGSQAK